MIVNQDAVCAHKRMLLTNSFDSIHAALNMYKCSTIHTAGHILRALKSMIGQAVFAQGTVCRECQAEAETLLLHITWQMVWFGNAWLHKGSVSTQ